MRALKKLLFSLMVGIYMISLNVNAVSASEQICFNLSLDPYPAGDGPIILQLGGMDYGNYHSALAGTDTTYVMPGHPSSAGLVNGNADIVNDKVEVSLTGTWMSGDNTTAFVYFYHLRLDPTTLSGVYTLTANDIAYRKGPVSLVQCP